MGKSNIFNQLIDATKSNVIQIYNAGPDLAMEEYAQYVIFQTKNVMMSVKFAKMVYAYL